MNTDILPRNKNDIFLSFIVPVYNVGKYLKKCIDSLLHQDISRTEYEIVCVDDGSTDDSGSILDEYAKQNDFVKVIHQKNGGLSAARNTGIRNARGKYFWFIDSDDYIKDNIFGKIKESLMESDCDCLSVLPYTFKDGQTFDEKTIGPEKMDTERKSTLWTKILKACNIVDHSLFFQTEFTYIEDAPFMIQLRPFLKKTMVLNEIGYFYRQRPGSLMGQRIESKVENRIRVAAFCQKIIRGEETGDAEEAKKYLYVCVSNAMGNISKFNREMRAEFLQKIKESNIIELSFDVKYTPRTVKNGEPLKKKITHRLNDFSYKKAVFYLLVILHRKLF